MRRSRKKQEFLFLEAKRDKMNKQGVFEIPYNQVTLEEALHRLQTHDGEGWLDAGRETVVLIQSS